jgi:peptidyl-prolyl cis-trans isomerase SurA
MFNKTVFTNVLRKPSLQTCLLGALLACSNPLFAQPVVLDGILAVVEDDVVLQSEFDERWAQFQQQLANAQGQLPPEDVLCAYR